MSEYISEQDILKLLKKLDQDARSLDQRLNSAASFNSPAIHAEHEVTNGFIKIEDGKIIVGNPSNGGEFPTLRAIPPVKLFVDGNEVKKETKVSSESAIEWKIEEKPLFEISISEDKLEAYLTVNRTQRYAWSIKDHPPVLHGVLRTEEDPSIILETLSLQDVLSKLENMNIKANLDVAAIQAEILQPSHRKVRIARGKPPVQGHDAQLELYFSESIENVFTEIKGVVDFRNHLNIPSVKRGDVIAKKIPPVEGQAGYDVFGNAILPKPVKDILIAGKNDVEITPDSVVIAKKAGRPRVTGNKIKYFDISTSFIIPGNVDLETGNIVFSGDVIVYGDVMDNMIIECLGNIYVAGSVFNSTLTATGSIAVQGNVIGSNLYSGYFGVLYNRFYHSSKQLLEILEKIIESEKLLMKEISKKNMQVRYGQVILLIIESKYQQVWGIVKELLGVIASLQSHNSDKDHLQQIKTYLELFLQPTNLIQTITAPKLEDFMRILREAYMKVALSQERHVQISISQSQNSTLKSNGDILIKKEGIIQCELYSAGNIIFFLDNSVCRGSKLEAGDTISAMYVGGLTGVGTSLKAGRKVIVKKMFEGRVTVDRYSVDIFEPIEDKTFDRNSFI